MLTNSHTKIILKIKKVHQKYLTLSGMRDIITREIDTEREREREGEFVWRIEILIAPVWCVGCLLCFLKRHSTAGVKIALYEVMGCQPLNRCDTNSWKIYKNYIFERKLYLHPNTNFEGFWIGLFY